MSSPRFNLDEPRYDQSTYLGRVRHFLGVIDPLTLLSSDKTINDATDLVNKYKRGEQVNASEEELWGAKKIKDACVHPDTGKVIFAPFRLSAFVPLNIPLVVGMLSASTPAATAFWQFANQSYNVAVNYANRNASKEMDMEKIAKAYAGAVLSSCTIAIGLGKFVANLNARPNPGLGIKLISNAVPFLAVASAGSLNVGLMRMNEAQEGISIKDHEGNERGISIAAGKKAVFEVALTRVALPAPILLFPPLIMSIYDRTKLAATKPTIRPFVNVSVITMCLWAALPLAIGLFPQTSSITVDKLEDKFKNMTDSKGNKIETFYFNKGL